MNIRLIVLKLQRYHQGALLKGSIAITAQERELLYSRLQRTGDNVSKISGNTNGESKRAGASERIQIHRRSASFINEEEESRKRA